MNRIRERLNEKAARNKIPIMSAMELLPVCNLQCKMCYVRKSMEEVKRLGGLKDGKWWLDIAKQGADMGMVFPLLTGGEPFLHPDFPEILDGMLSMGLQVSVNTNGTLIDRDMARWLSKHRPTRINLTLYGASEESYENLCGHADAYEKVLRAVALLKEYDIPLKFNASITSENFRDIEKLVSFARENGSPIQVATYMFPPIRRDSSMTGQNARLSPEMAALARVSSDYYQNEPRWFLGRAEAYASFVPRKELDRIQNTEGKLRMSCRAGLSSMWIDWQGVMTNCGMYGSVQVDLNNRSLEDCWKELVEKNSDLRLLSSCANCPNRHLCHPCIAMIHNECGDSKERAEYVCRMNEEIARLYAEYAHKYYPDMLPVKSYPEYQDACELDSM